MTFEFQTLVSLPHFALHVAVLERPRLIERRAHDTTTKILQQKSLADREVGEALRERLDLVSSQDKSSAHSEIPKALGERPQLVTMQAKIPSELQRPELLGQRSQPTVKQVPVLHRVVWIVVQAPSEIFLGAPGAGNTA